MRAHGKEAEYEIMCLSANLQVVEEKSLASHIFKSHVNELVRGKERHQAEMISRLYANLWLLKVGAPRDYWKVYGNCMSLETMGYDKMTSVDEQQNSPVSPLVGKCETGVDSSFAILSGNLKM